MFGIGAGWTTPFTLCNFFLETKKNTIAYGILYVIEDNKYLVKQLIYKKKKIYKLKTNSNVID
jgi:hypothetical protein